MNLILLLTLGLVALVAGAEFLVRGASQLAARLKISPLVIGLTVVAFGTSAPEMAVSVSSSLAGQADIAVGNVVGSNIFNVLLILGVSALVVPLAVDQQLVRTDVPLMLAVSGIMWWFASDQHISRIEGCILFSGLLAYTAWCVISARRESSAIQHEYEEAFLEPEKSSGTSRGLSGLLWQLSLVVTGLVLLVFGANWLVASASELARRFGISELVIGLTIVAGGTSLPELATSVMAALKGERDIAVGNVVGSNLFNILGVLGLTAILSQSGVAVAEQALHFDLPVMFVVAVACLPVFTTGHEIARWEGALFLSYYVAYTVVLVRYSIDGTFPSRHLTLLLGFVLPLAAITLVVLCSRVLRQRESLKESLEKD